MSDYEAGWRAAANGSKPTDNPHRDIAVISRKLEWSRGFFEGQSARQLVDFIRGNGK